MVREDDGELPIPFEHTNFGVPHSYDLLRYDQLRKAVDRSNYPIQAKYVRKIDKKVLHELAQADEVLKNEWTRAESWLNSTENYAEVAPTSKEKKMARVRMNAQRFGEYCKAELCEEVPNGAEKAGGYTRLFLCPEDERVPPRFRVISHCVSANQIKKTEDFSLPKLDEILGLAEEHPFAVTMDMTAFFNQFELSEDVRKIFSFFRGPRRFQHTRLPMGFRQACFVAQTAMRILAKRAVSETGVSAKIHIDNIVMFGSKEAVEKAAKIFIDDCQLAGATIGEVQTTPCTKIKFGGMLLDLLDKKVEVLPKTLKKLDLLNQAAFETHRRLAGVLSSSLFCSRVLGINLAEKWEIFELWRAFKPPSSDDQQAIETFWESEPKVKDETKALIRSWVDEIFATGRANITVKFDGLRPDRVYLGDASKDFYAGIALDGTQQIYSVVGKNSTKSKSSSVTEPWAVYHMITNTTERYDQLDIVVGTDNSGTMAAINRGFARSWHANRVAQLLAQHRPHIRVHAFHIPGVNNPADPLSRGRDLEASHWARVAEAAEGFSPAVKRVIAEAAFRAPHIPFRLGVSATQLPITDT